MACARNRSTVSSSLNGILSARDRSTPFSHRWTGNETLTYVPRPITGEESRTIPYLQFHIRFAETAFFIIKEIKGGNFLKERKTCRYSIVFELIQERLLSSN